MDDDKKQILEIAAMILNGRISANQSISALHGLSVSDRFLEDAIYTAKRLVKINNEGPTDIHAYQLFQESKQHTAKEIAATFKKAGWPAMTESKTIRAKMNGFAKWYISRIPQPSNLEVRVSGPPPMPDETDAIFTRRIDIAFFAWCIEKAKKNGKPVTYYRPYEIYSYAEEMEWDKDGEFVKSNGIAWQHIVSPKRDKYMRCYPIFDFLLEKKIPQWDESMCMDDYLPEVWTVLRKMGQIPVLFDF